MILSHLSSYCQDVSYGVSETPTLQEMPTKRGAFDSPETPRPVPPKPKPTPKPEVPQPRRPAQPAEPARPQAQPADDEPTWNETWWSFLTYQNVNEIHAVWCKDMQRMLHDVTWCYFEVIESFCDMLFRRGFIC